MRSSSQAVYYRPTFVVVCAGFKAATLLWRPGFLAGGVRGPSVAVAAPVRPDFRGGLHSRQILLAVRQQGPCSSGERHALMVASFLVYPLWSRSQTGHSSSCELGACAACCTI